MKINQSDVQLSPSAEELINKMEKEFRQKTINGAYRIAKLENTCSNQVSLQHVLDFNTLIWIKIRMNARWKWVLLILALTGLGYGVFGLFFFLVDNIVCLVKNLGLSIAALGTFMAFSASVLSIFSIRHFAMHLYFKLNNTRPEFHDGYDLVVRWHTIEKEAGKVLGQLNRKRSGSFNETYYFLTTKVANNKSESAHVKKLLNLRNRIVHDNYSPSRREKRDFVIMANELLTRLEAFNLARV